RLRITLIAWCLCFSWMPALESYAQQPGDFLVQGSVTDGDGIGLPGVTILLKETSAGTTTDVEGNYRLNVPEGQQNGTLVFSFVGFETQEVPIGGRAQIDIQLSPSVYSLDEVVVVGYGT